MRIQFSKLAFSAALGLALTFTLSCSSGSDDNGGGTSSQSGGGDLSSSSVGDSGGGGSSSSATGGGGSSSSVGGGDASSSSVASGGGCSGLTGNSGTITDIRDNKPYKWVRIDEQCWLAENLNYDVPDNDTDVCYDNNPANCVTYGRLYNWVTAMANSASSIENPSGVRGICPEGWHIPSSDEWGTLRRFVGNNPGTKLKANSNLWSNNGKGTDDYYFAALPGGYANVVVSSLGFHNVGDYGYWWSSTEATGTTGAWGRSMSNGASMNESSSDKTETLWSVRCVKD